MSGSLLGPEFSQGEMEGRLRAAGARYETMNDDRFLETTVDALIDQKAIGWFQGRMEFGPRALGSRSILGDPRAPDMQKRLNLKIKYRESFRPFAPAVLDSMKTNRYSRRTRQEPALIACLRKLRCCYREAPTAACIS